MSEPDVRDVVLELRGYALFHLVSEDTQMARWVLLVPDLRDLLSREGLLA